MTSPAPSRRAFLAASLRTTAGTFAGAVLLAVAFWGVASSALAETGRDLWLRYAPIEDVQLRGEYRSRASAIVVPRQSPTGRIIAAELQRGLRGLLGVDVPVSGRMTGDGAILVGTPASSPEIAALGWATALRRAGDAGYVIRTVQAGGHAATVIASGGDIGALYGAFHFLRLIQSRTTDCAPRHRGTPADRPSAARPLGQPRWHDRARLRRPVALVVGGASRAARSAHRRLRARQRLDRDQRDRAEQRERQRPSRSRGRISRRRRPSPACFRPYGIRVYLSANFNAPRALGGLKTADPLDPAVAAMVAIEG